MPVDFFSLLNHRWLPVLRRDLRTALTRRDHIRPCDLTDQIGTEPVVAFDWRRPDFDAASREFMIGLLATACPPTTDNDDDWYARWDTPPTPDDLNRAFAPFAEAFVFDGDGPRFMQDRDELDGDPVGIAGLLIDNPGQKAVDDNLDFFAKRGRTPALSRASAAMALFVLQTFAPAGGAGHRTSLRGGGPLTTLVMPKDPNAPLWHTLWLAVPTYDGPATGDLALVFPWLAPTRTSEDKKPPTTPSDIDPARRQCFWGMPRRIRLAFRPTEPGETGALDDASDDVVVAQYRTRPWGVNYAAVAHPLSPMYRQKPDTEWLFVHPQPDGITYRHWVDLVAAGSAGSLRRRADCVGTALGRLQALRLSSQARLSACGYDMDNMKARGFVEAEMPLFVIKAATRLDSFARDLVAAANHVASRTAAFVGDAIGAKKADATARAALRERLFDDTQTKFFDLLDQAAHCLEKAADDADYQLPLARDFLATALTPTALRLFDDAVPLTDLEPRSLVHAVQARRRLVLMLAGRGGDGATLFGALKMPVATPQPKAPKLPKAKGRKTGKTAEETTA